MKRLNTIVLGLFMFLTGIFIYSCSDGDEYLKYTEGGEISYTGKIDSLEIYPGRNRVKIEGLIISDPKVSEVRIYWNLKNDSVVVPVNRTAGVDTVSVEIDNLPENIYNFEIRTFDKKNNQSVAVFESAEVYSERYQNSLFNRPISDYEIFSGRNLRISFASMDLTTGVIGTEILKEGDSESVYIPIEDSEVFLDDYRAESTYKYRTVFLPEEEAIDTFYTEYALLPKARPALLNSEIPFKASAKSGRWGILEDWVTTEPIKIHDGYGGWDEWNGNIFNVESGWGASAVINGKIYQTIEEVSSGTYVLDILIRDTNHELSDEGGSYFVVAKGNTLPDVSDVETAKEVLAYKRINVDLGSEYTYRIEFTIEDEKADITVGQITTQADSTPGRFCNVRSWDIVVK